MTLCNHFLEDGVEGFINGLHRLTFSLLQLLLAAPTLSFELLRLLIERLDTLHQVGTLLDRLLRHRRRFGRQLLSLLLNRLANRCQLGTNFRTDRFKASADVLTDNAFAQDTLLVDHSDILLGHGRSGQSDQEDWKKEERFERFHYVRTLYEY